MFPVDEGFKPTHGSSIIQREDIFGLDGHGAQIGVFLENNHLTGNKNLTLNLKGNPQRVLSTKQELLLLHLREQVHQSAPHMDGLQGELLPRAVQQSSCHVLQRVLHGFHVFIHRKQLCTQKPEQLG